MPKKFVKTIPILLEVKSERVQRVLNILFLVLQKAFNTGRF